MNKIFCSFLRYVIINHKLIKGKDYEKAINDGMPRSLGINWL